MGSWAFVSYLPFIALLSWNVHGFPAEDSGQHDPNDSGFFDIEAHPPLHYDSLPGAPPVPADPNDPAVSFMYDPVRLGTARLQTSPPSFRATPGALSAPSGFGPVEGSTPTFLSGTSHLRPDFSFPPAQLEVGHLGHDEGNFGFGNSERGTHGLGFTTSFQSGALSNYVATYEHGNSERETKDYFPPVSHAYRFALPGTVSQYYLRSAPPVDWLVPLWYGVH